MNEDDKEMAKLVTCPACNSKPGDLCTTSTDNGRRVVKWVHYSRFAAISKAVPE